MADPRFTEPIITILEDTLVGEDSEGVIRRSWAECGFRFVFVLSSSVIQSLLLYGRGN